MNFKPHDYQAYAIKYIKEHSIAAILLDMGLGKTVISLTAMADLLFDSFEVHKILVIGPLRVARDSWPMEWLVENNDFDYDMVVIDELSSFKNHSAKRFKALQKVRPKVKRIVGLTGTPSSNGLMDLWSEFRLLDMGERLGKFITRYREAFFMPDKRNGQQVFSYKPRPYAEEEIYRRISDITISMKCTDRGDVIPG